MTTTPTERFEVYRVILDYEALQEMFRDRVEDLNTSRISVDDAGNFTPGYAAKLLCDPPMKTLGKESLGKMLDATGMALIAVVDDARFAKVKHKLIRRVRRHRMLANGSIKQPTWLFTREISQKMQILRNKKLTPHQRKMIAKRAARARWKRRPPVRG